MVRGAYMVEENKLARAEGKPSPIFDSIQKTHNNYDSNVEYLISKLNGKSQVTPKICFRDLKTINKGLCLQSQRKKCPESDRYD